MELRNRCQETQDEETLGSSGCSFCSCEVCQNKRGSGESVAFSRPALSFTCLTGHQFGRAFWLSCFLDLFLCRMRATVINVEMSKTKLVQLFAPAIYDHLCRCKNCHWLKLRVF